MRRGNISNKPTPTILVLMDSSMYHTIPQTTLLQKVKHKLGLVPKYTLNPKYLGFLNKITYKTDYNLNLVFLDGFSDLEQKENLIKSSTLWGLNILTISDQMLDTLLDYTECYLVSGNSYRDKVYSIDEAYKLFR